ncbi:MAG: 30S ribosomal protein S7 [Cyanobacteria bacterium]|nr:30S ribosomal protein S7 [Cyanobacteriota bacterium]MDA1020388.1 30S ribosomal protein S7 [Cyanobacteriota bacterium]
MPRKDGRFKRKVAKPDPRFNDTHVGAFINRMMVDGKKSTAEGLFYKTLGELDTKVEGKAGVDIFRQAVKNAMPLVKVKAKRIGGATYQVPSEVEPRVSEAFAHRWLIIAARKRSGRSFIEKLSNELLDAFNHKGKAVETKESTHKMAEANKAYAHFGRN